MVLKEHMGDAQGSIGDIQGGVETYGGVGASGVSKCMGASKHVGVSRYPQIYGGVNSMPPSVKLTCH